MIRDIKLPLPGFRAKWSTTKCWGTEIVEDKELAAETVVVEEEALKSTRRSVKERSNRMDVL